MSLKSDLLELGFSIFSVKSFVFGIHFQICRIHITEMDIVMIEGITQKLKTIEHTSA